MKPMIVIPRQIKSQYQTEERLKEASLSWNLCQRPIDSRDYTPRDVEYVMIEWLNEIIGGPERRGVGKCT